ncbi:hypothetical protein Tco_0554322 [Tanacetum coccineum]
MIETGTSCLETTSFNCLDNFFNVSSSLMVHQPPRSPFLSGIGSHSRNRSTTLTTIVVTTVFEQIVCKILSSKLSISYVSLIRKKFCWGTIFPIGLKRYSDPKEEPIEKEPLMELKEIGIDLRIWLSSVERVHEEDIPKTAFRTRYGRFELRSTRSLRRITRHVVNNNDIHVDSRKIEAMKNYAIRDTIILGIGRVYSLLRRVESRIRLCTHAKRQGRERDSKNVAWPGPTNGKEGKGDMYLLWVPLIGDVRTLMMDEARASRLPRSSSGYDTNWVIVDRLTKAEVGESGLIRPSWYKRQPTRFEVGDKVMLEVSSWKDVVHLEKKEMLAPIYYFADTNLHVHLEELKVDKTFCFVEEPVGIIDHEVKSLKGSKILIVKSIGTRSEDEISLRRGYCDNRALSRGEEYQRGLFEIGDVGVVLFGRGEGEDDIENLRRSERFRSEDVIEMKKNDERMAGPKENKVKVAEKEETGKFHGSPDGGPVNLKRSHIYLGAALDYGGRSLEAYEIFQKLIVFQESFNLAKREEKLMQ